MFLHCLYLLTPEVWKCGEMCLHCLYPKSGSVENWKSGNVSRLFYSNNSESVKIWKDVWDDFGIKNRTRVRRN